MHYLSLEQSAKKKVCQLEAYLPARRTSPMLLWFPTPWDLGGVIWWELFVAQSLNLYSEHVRYWDAFLTWHVCFYSPLPFSLHSSEPPSVASVSSMENSIVSRYNLPVTQAAEHYMDTQQPTMAQHIPGIDQGCLLDEWGFFQCVMWKIITITIELNTSFFV